MEDNIKEIICPACGEKMVAVSMPSKGCFVDVCVNGCGGIFLDNREFKHFDEPHEDISPIIEVLKDKEFKTVDQSAKRKCPACGADMVKNFASAKHEVQVDDCYSCGGKFLDYNELNKIRTQYNTEEERANDFVKKLYEEVGVENIIPVKNEYKSFAKEGLVVGFLFGVILSGIYCYLNHINFNDIDSVITVVCFIVGACLFGYGTGALALKKR